LRTHASQATAGRARTLPPGRRAGRCSTCGRHAFVVATLTVENHGATVRHFTDEQRRPRCLAGAMAASVRDEPLAQADSAPHGPTPSRVVRRSGFGARTVAYLIVNVTV